MSEPRTFSEAEMLAIITDRVATETANLKTESLALKATVEALSKEKAELASVAADVTTLTAEKADLATKLDVALAEKAAAEKAAADAVQAHEDFKAALEAEKATLVKKDERLVAVKAAAAHLPEEFFADEDRVARIVAMSDETFAGYVADLAATAGTAPKADAPKTTEIAKTTAMSGKPVDAPVVDTDLPRTAAMSFLLPGLVTEGGK